MKLKTIMGASLTALALTLAACDSGSKIDTESAVKTAHVPSGNAILGSFGIATEHMDKTVNPGDNFYAFVNGNWLAKTEIPSDKSAYGSFIILRDKSEKRVREIIESAATKANPSADEKRIGDFYNAYLNTDRIEKTGLKPIQKDLNRIKAAKSHDDILKLMSDAKLGLASPVAPFVYIDFKQNDQYLSLIHI